MLMRWGRLTMREGLWGLAIAACVMSPVAAAPARTAATDVCVIMTGSNGQVSGLQLDLSWDPTCMTAERGAGDAAKCNANPATGKSVQTKLFPNNSTLRALFLSVSDTSPVPDDELFCCRFTFTSAQANPCCVARIDNLILANPNVPGNRIYDAGISVQALVGNTPCTASAPGGSPSAPVRPPLPSSVAPVAPAPVIAAPGAEPPPPAPILPGPNRPAAPGTGQPPAAGGHVPAAAGPAVVLPGAVPPARGPTPATAAESAPVGSMLLPTSALAGTATPRRTTTPQRTPTAGTPTPARTPQAQGTGTPANAVESVTPAAQTPTPPPRAKHRGKKTTH